MAPKKSHYVLKRGGDGLTRNERFDLMYEIFLLARQEIGQDAHGLELTQREVGDLLGINHATVSLIEISAFVKMRAENNQNFSA